MRLRSKVRLWRAWDWVVTYLIPARVYVWWYRCVWRPIRARDVVDMWDDGE